jgi:hypothetical protein
MPVRELGSAFEVPNGSHAAATTLLKRHKVLPHPPHDSVRPTRALLPAAPLLDLTIDTGISSGPSSAASSPHTLKHASRRIGPPVLPPTPPAHSRQSSGSQSTIASAPRDEPSAERSTRIASTPGTPPNQRSPPTPDVTPPRAKSLTLRPAPRERCPSSQSRTDSFRTARENPYSSDEDVSTVQPTLASMASPGVQVTPPRHRRERRKEVGLGLGLESDNEGTTTPKADTASLQDFVVFDGEWAQVGEEGSEVEREWDDNLMRNVMVRKRRARKPYKFTDGTTDEVVEDDVVSPTMATKVVRGLPLHERIARHRLEREAERFGERLVRPSAVPDFDTPTSADVRRFSAMSGRSATSTVIEAIVVETTPERKQTLRRSKKQLGLRDLSDQSSVPSGPSSVISSEPQHKLTRKIAQIAEKRHRSLASNATVSTTSSSGKSRRRVISDGGIPVIVIPDRISSAKTSKAPSLRSTSSHKTKRTTSLSSAPLSQSSKFNEPGYIESNPPRKRTMSESERSGRSERTIDFPPSIPTRRSSLSAPTSRNTSRAGSLTAESLKAHNLIHEQEAMKPEILQSQPSESQKEFGQSTRLSVDPIGDPFFGNRRSTQVTPFSQSSYETAGTAAEVSEALAVSIFPHQNTSLLLVQQRAAPSQPSPPTLKAIHHSRPEPPVNSELTITPVTPPQPAHAMEEVDSPLRNPRAAPEPPAIKFIPPTPATLVPDEEEDREVGQNQRPATADTPKRGMSLMRRAFSNRRNSETSIQPVQDLIKRTFSLTGRRRLWVDGSSRTPNGNANPSMVYPSDADRPDDDTRLHPFWRPTHFWDDLEDTEDGSGVFDGRYAMIDNRPSPARRTLSGKLKRTFAILPIKDDQAYPSYSDDRRPVSKAVDGPPGFVQQGNNSGLRRGPDGRLTYESGTAGERPFGYGFPEGNGGKTHTIPGLGIRVDSVRWDGVKRRLSERKRAQRSDKLRAIISHPRVVQNGMDDILRRRSYT